MDPIFKNNKELKREYQNLCKNILPSLNTCGNCNKFKCDYCFFRLIVMVVQNKDAEIVSNLINQKSF